MRQIVLWSSVLAFLTAMSIVCSAITKTPSDQYLAQDWYSIFAVTSPNSNHLILPKSRMIRLDSSLNVLNTSVFCKSVIVYSVLEKISRVWANLWILFVRRSYWSAALCGTLLTRKSIYIGFYCPAIDLSMLVCCCNFLSCCICQASFNTVLGDDRGVRILRYNASLSVLAIFFNTIC